MTETVTVACKLPNGLVLRVFNMVERSELVLGGGSRKIKQAVQSDHAPIKINGCAAPFGSPQALYGGYALTPNVPKDVFDEWLKQNADADVVRNNLIFAADKTDYVADKATEQRDLTSGLQPLSQEGDSRAPKRVAPDDGKAA